MPLLWKLIIAFLTAITFILALAWTVPGYAYESHRWMLSFDASEGVDCLDSKRKNCAKVCHAVPVKTAVAEALVVGSVVYVNGTPLVIEAIYPSQDRLGRSFVTGAGCVFNWAGG